MTPKAHQPALVWDRPGTVLVRDVPVPVERDGWVPVDVAYAGICGSDLHIVAGQHPRAKPGCVLGHEFVGRLARNHGGLAAGREVFADPMVPCRVCDACRRGLTHVCDQLNAVGVDYPGALAPRVLVPASGLYALPEGTDLRRAALIEPVAVAVRAVRRSGLTLGQRVHVVGGGPIGCTIGLLARAAGAATVTVSEPARARREAASALGLETVEALVGAGGADVVFDASGHPSAAATLASWTRAGGTVVLVGGYPPGPQGLDLLRFMFAELSLIGTRIYTRSDIEAAIALVTAGILDLDPLVSDVLGLQATSAALDRLRTGTALKILIEPTR